MKAWIVENIEWKNILLYHYRVWCILVYFKMLIRAKFAQINSLGALEYKIQNSRNMSPTCCDINDAHYKSFKENYHYEKLSSSAAPEILNNICKDTLN